MTTPWEDFVASGRLKPGDVPSHWDWKALIPGWVFIDLQLQGYPHWDQTDDCPPFVMFEHCGDASRSVAQKFDDIAMGLFAYRDWTATGLPIVSAGDMYWSGFWFQRMLDAEVFHAAYGGIASWEPNFKEKRAAMTERRLRRFSA